MRYVRSISVAVVALVALLAVPSVSDAQATKVAVVKPAQIFQKMAETQDLKAKMESEAAPLNAVEMVQAIEYATDAFRAEATATDFAAISSQVRIGVASSGSRVRSCFSPMML